MPLIDPRHEPGLASLIVSDGVLFRTLRGWTGTFISDTKGQR